MTYDSGNENLPRYALIKGSENKGKVWVVGYHRNGRFFVSDWADELRYVHRDRLIFLPG